MNIKNTVGLLLLLPLLYAVSCEKDAIDNNDDECIKNCDTIPNELIRWESPFVPLADMDNVNVLLGGPVIAGNTVVYARLEGKGYENLRIKFVAYDRFEGDLLWNSTASYSKVGLPGGGMRAVGDQIIVFGDSQFLNLSVSDGSVNARRNTDDFPDGYAHKTIIGEKIYFTSESSEQQNAYTNVNTCNLSFTDWETITTIEEDTPTSVASRIFTGNQFYRNENGDLIGLYMNQYPGDDYYRSIVLALNLSNGDTYQDRLLWNLDIQSNKDFALHRTHKIYHDSLFIIVGQRDIFGIDLSKGILGYKTPMKTPNLAEFFTYPLADNTILLPDYYRQARLIKASTGHQIDIISDVEIPPSGVKRYKGQFYFVNRQRLISINPERLEVVWNYTPQRRNSNNYGNQFPYIDGIAIDPENKLLYTTDTRYALCIKLPE